MGVAKAQRNAVLEDAFAVGNVIKLFKTVPDEKTEEGGELVSGALTYTIKDGDFSVADGVVSSTKNMLMYLCENTDGHGTAEGFGTYKSNSLRYFGKFKKPMQIDYNTVPTIKKYNGSDEGIHITLTSIEVTDGTTTSAE